MKKNAVARIVCAWTDRHGEAAEWYCESFTRKLAPIHQFVMDNFGPDQGGELYIALRDVYPRAEIVFA